MLFSTEWLGERLEAALVFEELREASRKIEATGDIATVEALALAAGKTVAEVRSYCRRNPKRMKYLGIIVQTTSQCYKNAAPTAAYLGKFESVARRYNDAKAAAMRDSQDVTSSHVAHYARVPAWMIEAFAMQMPHLFSLD